MALTTKFISFDMTGSLNTSMAGTFGYISGSYSSSNVSGSFTTATGTSSILYTVPSGRTAKILWNPLNQFNYSALTIGTSTGAQIVPSGGYSPYCGMRFTIGNSTTGVGQGSLVVNNAIASSFVATDYLDSAANSFMYFNSLLYMENFTIGSGGPGISVSTRFWNGNDSFYLGSGNSIVLYAPTTASININYICPVYLSASYLFSIYLKYFYRGSFIAIEESAS